MDVVNVVGLYFMLNVYIGYFIVIVDVASYRGTTSIQDASFQGL